MSTVSSAPPSTAPIRLGARLPFLDRYLPFWIILAMGLGLGLGRLWPDLGAALNRVQIAGVSVPIAIGLFWMMYPVLAKVRYETVARHARSARQPAAGHTGIADRCRSAPHAHVLRNHRCGSTCST